MIELADVESPLTLFAEGIAGRYYHIKATSEFSSRRLTLSPEAAALSRDTIFVPATLDYPDSAAYRVLVLQQLGQQEFGTFDFTVSVAKEIIPQFATLATPEAALRESDFEFFYRHVEHPRVLQRLFTCCERARIAACVVARYPGSKRHVEAYRKHLRSTLQMPPLETLSQLLEAFDRYADGLLADGDTASALFEYGKSELQGAAHPAATVYDTAGAALHIYDHWMQQLAMPLVTLDSDAEHDDETSGWLQREARLEDWEAELKELNTTLAVEMLEGSDVIAGNAENLQDGELRPPDVDIKALKNEHDNLARRLDMERSAIRDALGPVRPLARSYRYDEWDYTQHRYLRHWCRLYEEKLPSVVQASRAEFQRVVDANAPGVLRQLEQIKPLGYRRVSRVVDGDELDFNALIEARLDMRAGRSPDERVYSRKERIHRDVCAAFLVDLSASTDDPIEPPEPAPAIEPPQDGAVNLRDPYDDDVYNLAHDLSAESGRRRIIDVQRESMLVMSAVLEQLGDSYGIYGFSGYGRDCVEFFVVKEPDQSFTQATLDAIASMSPKRSTRMGPAIRHATRKLLASGNALKLLIILSDGFPQDCDYGPTRGDHEYGLQDTAKALQEAQVKGVESFCVTVDKSGHDYLKRMCPESRYLVIEEIEDLPQALSKVYQTLAGK